MITIHHLGVSQSDRVVWLMEELELPYELAWYDRGPDGLAPPEYRALHPAATAPVISDDDRVITESAVILEYICHRYADGRLTLRPEDAGYPDYLYWMHFNNNVQGLFFAGLALGAAEGPQAQRVGQFLEGRRERYYGYLDARLAKSDYLVGAELTCADIMVAFNLTSLARFGGRTIADLANVSAYLERIRERPAYARAMSIAGPEAKRPA